jgi:exopolysaccharide biosynthesis polyprenyl glycosylphosphotransferase
MSECELKELLVKRYGSVQGRWGVWRLNSYMLWKRVSWRCLIAGTLLVKRALDIAAASLLIILLSPLLLVLAMLVKWHDGGPILFSQKRIGRWGRPFNMLKFRTMCVDAEARLHELLPLNQHVEGVTFKVKNDPRITPIGRWMRRFSLDELPQFFNVLRGEMSLVGPRPPLPREVECYSWRDRRRLAVTPGLTCFWQIGGRSEIDFSGQVQLDIRYIESQSVWLDLYILLRTVPAVLSGRGAC